MVSFFNHLVKILKVFTGKNLIGNWLWVWISAPGSSPVQASPE
jgi:hypothetical protein